MIRHITFNTIVAGLGLSVFAGVALAGPPKAGVGTTGSCTFVGKAKIKPALVFSGTATSVTTKLGGTLTCTGIGSGDGTSVVRGKVKGEIPGVTNDCLSLYKLGLRPFSGSIKWKVAKHTAKLLPTTANFVATPPKGINPLTGPGGSIVITITGTDAAGGSFAGNAITVIGYTDQTTTDFANACAAKGLKKFTFGGVHAPSTITQ